MGAWMNWPWALLAICLAPLVLMGAVGMVLLVLKIITIAHKAAEPRTVDENGHYSLDQGKEVGRRE